MMTLPLPVSSPTSKGMSLQSHQLMGRYVQRFLSLGMSKIEAQQLACAVVQYTVTKRVKGQRRSLKMRQLMPVYWRRLIEVGVPLQSAKYLRRTSWLYSSNIVAIFVGQSYGSLSC